MTGQDRTRQHRPDQTRTGHGSQEKKKKMMMKKRLCEVEECHGQHLPLQAIIVSVRAA